MPFAEFGKTGGFLKAKLFLPGEITIKQSLNLDHLRCKSPDMIRREFWTILPAYNMDQFNLIAQKRVQPLTAGKPMI
ncbi:MAG: hypothetical protein DRP65_09420 [Planctomycetota bacterium]|nr:MAG: hypothetical protein DRP65_09420 [Planctomycetota bacterium]